MEKKQLTKSQQAAIDTRSRDLLISAAAGSGKTFTLTERIIESLRDKKADISKMLIVTFTKAAANNLREKIFSALSSALAQNPKEDIRNHLNEQLVKLGNADICTIDAFYLKLIRQNFSTLGLSSSVRIADNSELVILKKELMDRTIEHFYDTDEDFPSFTECFVGTKSINQLSEPMLKVYDSVISRIEEVEFIRIKAEELKKYVLDRTDFLSTVYGKIIRDELESYLAYCDKFFNSAYVYSANDPDCFGKRALTYSADLEFITNALWIIRDENTTYEQLRNIFMSYSPANLGSAKKENETTESIYYKTERGNIKDKINSYNQSLFSRTNDSILEEMSETADKLFSLYTLQTDFSRRLKEEKSRRNIMDFNDIRRYTYSLLLNEDGTPTDIALQYRKEYTDVYIDEYQDVDGVQDAIFEAISDNNRFMVGDIKQSIYGFRGAEPDIFANYRKSFYYYDVEKGEPLPDNSGNTMIFMSENFRCDKNVIDFTNLICSRIFEVSEALGYTPDDDLRFAKKDIPVEGYVMPRTEVSLIITKKDDEDEDGKKKKKKDIDDPTNLEIEADFIAEKIASLIGNENKANGKPIQAGDIAVIYRSNSMVEPLSNALKARGILCSEGGGGEYFENPDVLLTLSLLNTVDNPHRDIHLAATLCSPLFEFTMDDMIEIKLGASSSCSLYDALVERGAKDDDLGARCRQFDEKLGELRRNAASLPIDRFLRLLFESDLFVASGLLSDRTDLGEGGNLLTLYEYARTFESGSFKGLYNFIEFINTLIENDEKLETAPKGKSPDRVNLTTMHHSKGLEFPVCFVCGTGKKKNTTELRKSLLMDYPLGIGMKLSDRLGFSQRNTPIRDAVAINKIHRETEEEMRVLYVALTRAQERLYVTALSSKDPEQLLFDAKMKNELSCPYVLTHCQSFMDWILLPFVDPSVNTDCCYLRVYDDWKLCDDPLTLEVRENVQPEADQAMLEMLREKFAFSYGYSPLNNVPAKLSVSRLSPDVLDENDGSAELFEADKRTRIPDFFLYGKSSKASAAERGTATHLFLQFCDFEKLRDRGVDEEIGRLIEKKFIPQSIAELIYSEELNSFIGSELLVKIFSAKKILREQRFNLMLPASAFTTQQNVRAALSNESLAIQGVIDLILINENDEIELYDYKTDRLRKEEIDDDKLGADKMNALHGSQLSYYAEAVRRLFGKECSRICIYSTHSAKLYDIKEVPLTIV